MTISWIFELSITSQLSVTQTFPRYLPIFSRNIPHLQTMAGLHKVFGDLLQAFHTLQSIDWPLPIDRGSHLGWDDGRASTWVSFVEFQ